MALLWHKEQGVWVDRTGVLLCKKSGVWGKNNVYFKHGNNWQQLVNSVEYSGNPHEWNWNDFTFSNVNQVVTVTNKFNPSLSFIAQKIYPSSGKTWTIDTIKSFFGRKGTTTQYLGFYSNAEIVINGISMTINNIQMIAYHDLTNDSLYRVPKDVSLYYDDNPTPITGSRTSKNSGTKITWNSGFPITVQEKIRIVFTNGYSTNTNKFNICAIDIK